MNKKQTKNIYIPIHDNKKKTEKIINKKRNRKGNQKQSSFYCNSVSVCVFQ